MLDRNLTHYIVPRPLTALFLAQPGGSLANKERSRRRLHHVCKRLILVRCNHHRNGHVWLEIRRLGVEILAEIHDLQPRLTQRRPPRWRWLGLASRYNETNFRGDCLSRLRCHVTSEENVRERQ